jgi:hypothetical protein
MVAACAGYGFEPSSDSDAPPTAGTTSNTGGSGKPVPTVERPPGRAVWTAEKVIVLLASTVLGLVVGTVVTLGHEAAVRRWTRARVKGVLKGALGVLALLGVLWFVVGLFVAMLPSERERMVKELRPMFKDRLAEFDFDVDTLKPGGTLPDRPRLLFIERIPLNQSEAEVKGDKGRTAGKPEMAVHYSGISNDLIARTPDEVNVVVLIRHLDRAVLTYTNGSSGYQPVRELVVVDVKTRQVIDRAIFEGGMPDATVVRSRTQSSGSSVGTMPRGMGPWLKRLLERGATRSPASRVAPEP